MTTEEQASFTFVAILFFTIIVFFTFSFKSIIMVFTRSQRENMTRDELVEELLKLSDVTSKLSNLTEKF